jgi:hypothetical protein
MRTWVPLEVTVMLRLIPAHEPGGPQSVGGLFGVKIQNEQGRWEVGQVRELDDLGAGFVQN